MAGNLNFLLTIRDQASQAIRNVGGQFNALGQQAASAAAAFNRLTQAQNLHANSTVNLAHVTTRATAAFVDLAVANNTLIGSLSAFREFEKNMATVERITENTTAQMGDFEKRFVDLARSIGAVPIDRLGVIAGQAAQLGITGNANIIKFTQSMGKLETILPELGEQAPKLIARLLAVTGEGVQNVETFASMLVRAGKDASASEQAILHLTSVLSQSTAQFKLGSATLLGLGTSFAELGLQPELASTAMSRALQALNEASLANTDGMRQLTAITGITAEEFQKLVRENPAEALLKFADVLNALNKDGRSTLSFLTSLNLQASENIRVLGTVSENTAMIRQNVALMRAEAAKPTALNQEFEVALKTLDRQIIRTQNSWRLFKTVIGAALAPLAVEALNLLRAGLDKLAIGFQKMPAWGQQVVAWGAVAVPAILGVVTAIAAVRTALVVMGAVGMSSAFVGLTASAIKFTAALALIPLRIAAMGVIWPIITAIGGLIGTVVAAVGIIPVAIAAAVAAVVASGVAIYKYWDDIKAYFADGFVDGMVKLFMVGIGKMTDLWKQFVDWISFSGPKPEMQVEVVDPNAPGGKSTKPQVTVPNAQSSDVSAVTALTNQNLEVIKQLDQQSNLLEKIKKQEIALDQLRTLPTTDPQYRSPEELARLQGLVALEKQRADGVATRLKSLGEEVQTAMAYTRAEQNTLEVIQNQRQELERRGALTQKQLDDIKRATEELQAARQNTALRDLSTQLENSLASSKALTREAQLQVEIAQRINDFERQNGKLTDEQKGNIRSQIETAKQNENLKATLDRLDPVTAATRDYESEVRVLNQALANGAITAAQFQAALGQLNKTTLEARDPWGAQVKTMREQIQLQRITGDYSDADRQTQMTINELRQKGVVVTKEQAAAMQEYSRALADAQMSSNSGFEGWAKSVGSFRQGLLDVQREFTSQLSTGIVGVLQGDGKNAVANMFKNMGARFLQVGVDQAIKGIGESTGMFAAVNKVMGTDAESALARAKKATDTIDTTRSLQAQQVTVTAAAVTINGQTLSGIGLDQAKTFVSTGTITPGATGAPLFTQPGAVPGINAGPYVGSVTAPALSGDAVARSTGLLRQFEGYRNKAYWDVNAWRVGYGSDTTTDAAGRVSRVGQGTVIDRGMADMDLARRIPQFQDTIKQQVGYDRFNSFNPDTQAALTSVAYNYGKLPSRIVGTVQNGSYNDIAKSVEGLSGDNSGVNAARRAAEAELIRSSQQQVQQARETAQKVSEAQTQGGQTQVQAVANAQQQIASTAQTSGQSMQQLGQSVQQAGEQAQQAAPKMQQVSTATAQTSADTTQFAGGLGSLTGSFASAQLGLGQFGGALSTMLSSLFSGMSSGGTGFLASLFGGAGPGAALAAVAHSGWGRVGAGSPGDGFRLVNASTFASARRFHSGTNANEYKAILQRGERVLTENDAKRTDNVLRGVDRMAKGGGAPGTAPTQVKQTVSNVFSPGDTHIQIQGSSGNQATDDAYIENLEKMLDERGDRMMTAWVQNQMRSGGLLAQSGARRR